MMLENFFWQARHIKDISFHYSHLSPTLMEVWKQSNPNSDVTPPEKIPDELATSIINAKGSNHAMHHLLQLHLTTFEMTIHTPESHQAIVDTNFAKLWNRQRKEITMLSGPEDLGEGFEWGHGYSSFRAPMGGYDGGYYVYLVYVSPPVSHPNSSQMANQIFRLQLFYLVRLTQPHCWPFLSSQIYSLDLFCTAFQANTMNAKEGRRFRYLVLQPGGSQDEMTTMENFLGRKPNSDAFFGNKWLWK